MSSKHNYVAIMAGGIGSRFWPMSRTAYPKQFLDILNTGKTLIQQTYERYKKLVPEENIFIITSAEYVPIVKEQLPQRERRKYSWRAIKKKYGTMCCLYFFQAFEKRP